MPAIITYLLLSLGLVAVVTMLAVTVLIGRSEDAANATRTGPTTTAGPVGDRHTSIVIGHLVVNVNPAPPAASGGVPSLLRRRATITALPARPELAAGYLTKYVTKATEGHR